LEECVDGWGPDSTDRTWQNPEKGVEVRTIKVTAGGGHTVLDTVTPGGEHEMLMVYLCAFWILSYSLIHRSRGSQYGLQEHHIEWYSRGGPTVGENLLAVRSRCHALVHEGLLVVSGKAPGDVVFQDARGQALDQRAAAGSSRIQMGSLPKNGAAAPFSCQRPQAFPTTGVPGGHPAGRAWRDLPRLGGGAGTGTS